MTTTTTVFLEPLSARARDVVRFVTFNIAFRVKTETQIADEQKILRVSWIAKRTNEWVLNKAGVDRELLDTVKVTKLAYYGHTTRKQGNFLEKEIMQGTMPGARRRVRPRTDWMNNINTWTGSPVEAKRQSK